MDGCCACRKLGLMRYADAHHILSGGKRISHSHTIPLCEWHHRGYDLMGWGENNMAEQLGESLARNKRRFVAEFGTEVELLAETNSRYSLQCGLRFPNPRSDPND